MKRCMSSNVCFNFFTDPDVVSENDAICDYDVYIIFAECFSEDELTSKIDDAERVVYSVVSNETYTDNEAKTEIELRLNQVYSGDAPVIDVIIKDRKFLMNANRAAAWR